MEGDKKNKQQFAIDIRLFLFKHGLKQSRVSKVIGVPTQNFTYYLKQSSLGRKFPVMWVVMIADMANVTVDDLIKECLVEIKPKV